ncbi:hypothetical protein G7046_g4878 [Stylonectria norvegica]|nr:hypothetical protein G7046_g4878 [Stylonectria norvegica]
MSDSSPAIRLKHSPKPPSPEPPSPEPPIPEPPSPRPPSPEPPGKSCPWLTEEDLSLIGDLGLPDPYHWGNLQHWARRVLIKYSATLNDATTVRQRFIRLKCVCCRKLCEDKDPMTPIDDPVVFPCGHIMGKTCYDNFCYRFRMGEIPPTCPWPGPLEDEPREWSPACTDRIVFECDHTSIAAYAPDIFARFHIPINFFTSPLGGMSVLCRRCTVHEALCTFTRDARKDGRFPLVWAACWDVHGFLPGERAALFAREVVELQPLVEEHTQMLKDLVQFMPVPVDKTDIRTLKVQIVYMTPVEPIPGYSVEEIHVEEIHVEETPNSPMEKSSMEESKTSPAGKIPGPSMEETTSSPVEKIPTSPMEEMPGSPVEKQVEKLLNID